MGERHRSEKSSIDWCTYHSDCPRISSITGRCSDDRMIVESESAMGGRRTSKAAVTMRVPARWLAARAAAMPVTLGMRWAQPRHSPSRMQRHSRRQRWSMGHPSQQGRLGRRLLSRASSPRRRSSRSDTASVWPRRSTGIASSYSSAEGWLAEPDGLPRRDPPPLCGERLADVKTSYGSMGTYQHSELGEWVCAARRDEPGCRPLAGPTSANCDRARLAVRASRRATAAVGDLRPGIPHGPSRWWTSRDSAIRWLHSAPRPQCRQCP